MKNVSATLPHHARSRANHPAIITPSRTVLYGELDGWVSRTANHVMNLGVKPGEVVGLALSDSIEHVILMFALGRAGIIMLPIDWRWTPEEQSRVAEHFGASLVITEPSMPAVPGVRQAVVDDAWRAAVETASDQCEIPSEDGPLLMSLSSGTTGRPKGPLLNHHQFLRRFMGHWINLGFNAQDRFMSATPLYYGGGRTFSMLTLYSGGTLILYPPPYKPAELCAAIEQYQANSIFLVPTLLRRMLTLDDEALQPMQSMRLVLSSGAALHPQERHVMRKRLCPNFVTYYSSTEGGGVSYLTPDAPDLYDESVGRPVFGVEVQCVDADDQPVPAGEIGRVRYRSPAVASGFWNDPEATAHSFKNGWFYPGDLGMLNEDGYLFLKGRAKDMIIRGGVNIYPGEIEALLQTHPAVHEASVVGWPSKEFNEEVAAFVVLSVEVAPDELRAFCKSSLAPYKVPRQVFIVDELPRNTLGKVIKTDLSARLTPIE